MVVVDWSATVLAAVDWPVAAVRLVGSRVFAGGGTESM